MTETLFFVGVGPGDPELLTLKAVRVLSQVDAIMYPQKPGQPSMALNIARQHIPADKQLIPIDLPMQRERAAAQTAYDLAASQIIQRLNKNQSVAYLCEGDPLFYGSAMYLIERLADKASVEIVSGISSLNASAAAISRPLAARSDRLKILPATLSSQVLERELSNTEGAVIIKVGEHFDRVREVLEKTDMAANAMIVEHATGQGQTITPLREFAQKERPYFSTILCYAGAEAWAK